MRLSSPCSQERHQRKRAMSMPRSQGGDCLQRQFQDLQQDWDSYKRSVQHRRARSIPDLRATTPDFLGLLRHSPKKLLSSLQKSHSPSDVWKPRTNDRAVEEAVSDRRATIRSERLRGRRLLEALECAKDEVGFTGKKEMCSICSSVLVARSSCSCTTSSLDGEGHVGGYSSSSSSSLVAEEVERERIPSAVGVGGGGGRWVVRFVCLCLVVMVLALGAVSLREFGAAEYGGYVTPT